MPRRPQPTCLLITGASAGLGAALARAYAASGTTLILHGRDRARLEDVKHSCEAKGAAVELWTWDIADASGLVDALHDLADRHPIDLVIANAGVTHGVALRAHGESWGEIERVMAVNATGAMATVAGVLPSMRRRGSGQIALISSLSAWHGLALTPAYCASKAALKAYGEALGGLVAADGIEVAVILPGFVKSAMSDSFPGPRPFMMTPDQAAARIRRGLERGRARIAFPLPVALGMWCLGLLPARLSRQILSLLGYVPR